MKHFADSIDVASQQTLFHHHRLLFELVHRLDGLVVLCLHIVYLTLYDLGGDMAGLGVIEQQVMSQLVLVPLTNTKRVDDHFVVLKELHVVEPSESGGILVLFAARHT